MKKVVGGKRNTELMLAFCEMEADTLADTTGIRCQ